MRLVHDNAVKGSGRQPFGGIGFIQHSGDQRLDGRHLHLIVGLGHLGIKPRHLVDLGKVQQPLDLGRLQRVAGLFSQRLAVDQKQDAPEPLMFEQAVHQGDARAGFASSRGHRNENIALASDDCVLDRGDRLLLIRPHPALAEALIGQAGGRSVQIGRQDIKQVFGREPGRLRSGMVSVAAQIAEPYPRFCRPLTDKGPPIGGKDKWYTEGLSQTMPPGAIGMPVFWR